MKQSFQDTERAPRSLERAFMALEAFSLRPEWGVRELGAHLELPPSTAHGVLASLAELGVLRRTADGRYRLGWRGVVLGRVFERGFEPVEVARPVLEDLAEATGETIHLGALVGIQVVYLDKVEGRYAVRLASRVGDRFPAHATACGKALLAYDPQATRKIVRHGLAALTPRTITDAKALAKELDAVRRRGYAVDDEEIEPDAGCLAVPVRAATGAELAISVSGPSRRIASRRAPLRAALSAAALRLSCALYGTTEVANAA